MNGKYTGVSRRAFWTTAGIVVGVPGAGLLLVEGLFGGDGGGHATDVQKPDQSIVREITNPKMMPGLPNSVIGWHRDPATGRYSILGFADLTASQGFSGGTATVTCINSPKTPPIGITLQITPNDDGTASISSQSFKFAKGAKVEAALALDGNWEPAPLTIPLHALTAQRPATPAAEICASR